MTTDRERAEMVRLVADGVVTLADAVAASKPLTKHQPLFRALEQLCGGSSKAHDLDLEYGWDWPVCEAMAKLIEAVDDAAEKEGGAW